MSKSGPSITFGGKHARTTIGRGRVTQTVRTPIKGLYYSSTTKTGGGRRKSYNTRSRYNNRKKSKSSGGCLSLLGGLFLLSFLFYIGLALLYFGIIAGLLYLAYTYYKVHKTYTPDQYERFASILYAGEPEKKRGPWKIYGDVKKSLKNLPKEIQLLESRALAFSGENVLDLCALLDERDVDAWRYHSLLEISHEPEFYEPPLDNFYAEAFHTYIQKTFQPVYLSAAELKTMRGKEARYQKYLERFLPCYDQLPDSAKAELQSFIKAYDIHFVFVYGQQSDMEGGMEDE